MATLKLFVNLQTRELVNSFTDPGSAELPPFFCGDSGLVVEVHPLFPSVSGDPARPFEYLSPGAAALAMALGLIDEPPTEGAWHLVDDETEADGGTLVNGARYYISDFNSGDNFTNVGGTNATGSIFTASGTTPTTWSNGSTLIQIADALAYNISSAELQTAIQTKLTSNYSAATVAGNGPWLIDRITNGALTGRLRVISDGLTPDSFGGVQEVREGDDSRSLRQRVRLLQRPAAYASTTTNLPTYTTINATLRRAGSASPAVNEIQRISLPRDTYGGVWTLKSTTLEVAHGTTKQTGNIVFGMTESEIKTIIDAFFGSGNEVRVTLIDDFTIDIEYSGTNVKAYAHASLMEANIAGLNVPQGWTTTFNLNTTGAVSILGDEDELTCVFELQMSESGVIDTIFQSRSALLVNDLIDPESTGATEFPGYYSTVEVDALLDLITQRGAASVSAAGTTEVSVVAGCKWLTYRVTVGAGAGIYTHNIDLAAVALDRNAGDTVKVVLDMPASENPTVTVRDNTAPTTLYTAYGSGVATCRVLFFTWTGSAWESDQGAS